MTCTDVQQLLGVYVLGAVDARERELVQSHLAGCVDCRRELESLQDVPHLLDLLAPEDWERVAGIDTVPDAPPPAHDASAPVHDPQLERLLSSAAAVHTRRRWLTIVAAALLVLTGGGAVAAELWLDRQAVVVAEDASWSATDPDTGVRASVRLRPRPEGTAVDVDVSGVPSGTTCRLVVTAKDGSTSTAATWQVDYAGTARVMGSSPTQLGQVASLAVVTTSGQTLVSLEPPRAP